MTSYLEGLGVVAGAVRASDIFGVVKDPAAMYRELAKAIHPDRAPESHKDTASEAFAKLSRFWAEFNGNTSPTTISTKKQTYTLSHRIATGSLSNVYLASHDGVNCAIKLPKSPRDNDLMEREARALKKLSEVDEDLRVFVPALVDSFRHKDVATHEERRVNVLNYLDGFYPLTYVKECYPNGLDPRDVAWMWRRLLAALGACAQAGVVHGAIVPENVLIHPEHHGVVLVDWCYSVSDPSERVPAIVPGWDQVYAPEIPSKEAVDTSTDIYMATLTMAWLMGSNSTKQWRAFGNGCALKNMKSRPSDPWKLLGELDDLLERLYGPRKFRPFSLPEPTK